MSKPKDMPSPDINDRIIHSTLEISGVMPHMLRRNPELGPALVRFFKGEKTIMVVGGESGMGKSLYSSDVQRLDPIIQSQLPKQLQSGLTVISWDRVHDALFSMASHPYGVKIPLPKGETYELGRILASYTLSDAIRHSKRTAPKNRVLVETPLFGNRGETLFNELSDLSSQIQTIIMHSPRTRYEILQEGRMLETSGQPDAMQAMRDVLLRKIAGRNRRGLSADAQDELVKNMWRKQLPSDTIIVEWDPEDDRQGFKTTKEVFSKLGILTEKVSPSNVGDYISWNLFQLIAGLPNKRTFLKNLDPRNKSN